MTELLLPYIASIVNNQPWDVLDFSDDFLNSMSVFIKRKIVWNGAIVWKFSKNFNLISSYFGRTPKKLKVFP